MPSRDLALADPVLVAHYRGIKLTFELTLTPYELRPTCTHRSPAEQLVEFKAGRSMLDGQTPETMSKHNSNPSRAIDVGIFIRRNGRYLESDPALYWIVGLLAQARGLRWGGSWRHEERPYTRKPVDGYHIELM